MHVKIKICGITRYKDAKVAVNLGVDALGFVFSKMSPRYIEPQRAYEIIRKLPPFIAKVGVWVDESPGKIMDDVHTSGVDIVQLNGKESPEIVARINTPIIKAFDIDAGFDLSLLEAYNISAFLLNTWNTKTRKDLSMTFNWEVAKKAVRSKKDIILAGGLGPINIREALDEVQPYAVDVNSGVEIKPGVKNPPKMGEVVKIVKEWK